MNSVTIDSTRCKTDLCKICSMTGTDKSPFTTSGGHRHPYTAPYSLLFEPMRHKPIKFAEIGVYRGASLKAWRIFFSEAKLYGYDNDANLLNYIASFQLPNTHLQVMDGSNAESINNGLKSATADGELLDVILEDAAHDPEHQVVVIREGLKYLKQGGFLIIEDVFRERSEEPYEKILEEMKHLISFSTFIVCDHELRYSPGWNNDKLLVIVKA